MSLFPITDAARHAVFTAIDNGTAIKIDRACFRDGMEDEFWVDFYAIGRDVFRVVYNQRSTVTTVEQVTEHGEDGWVLHKLLMMIAPQFFHRRQSPPAQPSKGSPCLNRLSRTRSATWQR